MTVSAHDRLIEHGFSAEEAEDLTSGAPTPFWVQGDEERYRWRLARELVWGVAMKYECDPAEARRFVLFSTRSIYGDASIPTHGAGDSLEGMIAVKRSQERLARRRAAIGKALRTPARALRGRLDSAP